MDLQRELCLTSHKRPANSTLHDTVPTLPSWQRHPLISVYSRSGPLCHGTWLRTQMCQQQCLVLLPVPEWIYLECRWENMFPETRRGEGAGRDGGSLQMWSQNGFPEADAGCHPAAHRQASRRVWENRGSGELGGPCLKLDAVGETARLLPAHGQEFPVIRPPITTVWMCQAVIHKPILLKLLTVVHCWVTMSTVECH